MSTFEEQNDKDILSVPARVGEVISILCLMALFGFFLYHQTANTGFFTDKFGTLEMICLYVPLIVGIAAPAIRAWTGNRNPARPFEAAASLLLALGSLWLLIVFPLNYTHLADALPTALHFILAWVTDGVAKFVLLLQIIIGPLSALLTMWKYFTHHQHENTASFKRRML